MMNDGRDDIDPPAEPEFTQIPEPPSRSTAWWYLAGGVLIIGGVFYFAVGPKGRVEPAPPPAIVGWDDLALCSPVKSLDGTRGLNFFDDGRVEYQDNSQNDPSGHAPTKMGTWSFDPATRTYAVSLNDTTRVYSVIASLQNQICILLSGSIGAANLNESWFALIDDEPPILDRERDAPGL